MPVSDNIWKAVCTNVCESCAYQYPQARYVEVDAQGRCEDCSTVKCVECETEWMHVESAHERCSKCELAGAVHEGDEAQSAYWQARVLNDSTLIRREHYDVFAEILAGMGLEVMAR